MDPEFAYSQIMYVLTMITFNHKRTLSMATSEIFRDHHLKKKEYEAARLLGYRWYITKCVEKNDLGMATNKKDWFRLYEASLGQEVA